MSTWRVWGEPIAVADVSTKPTFFQPFTLDQDTAIAVIRSWLILVGSPTFTSAELRIYADHAGTPSALLYSSQAVLKSEMLTLAHGVKDVPFVFSPKPALKTGVTYNLALWLNGYSCDESSFIAWRKDFPSPCYPNGLSLSTVKLASNPFSMAVIGSRF